MAMSQSNATKMDSSQNLEMLSTANVDLILR
jgi:hypothetical protein